ncbi:MAG: hypothetical protein CME65_14745 [Halobacteriovoraceae bacterium]|nr:hypothetical protein [Halobacteriovoraceae bacterium]|tara:strand:+ start:6321 stop:8045 length:1725 start_codon:yes stop_codon:yes gene_type:complete
MTISKHILKFEVFMLSFALTLLSCGSLKEKVSKSQRPNKVKITIKEKAKDKWIVKYDLPVAERAVVFHRQINQFRQKEWKIKTPGLKFKLIDNQECIFSEDESFDQFEVEFESYFDHTPKDYEFFRKFSDGGRLIYTGHLYVHPVQVKHQNLFYVDEEVQWKQSLYASTPSSPVMKWEDKSLKGTYLFLGKTKPIDSNRVKAYIDQEIPRWIKNQLNHFFPKLVQYYNLKTGHDLSFKPVLYFDYSKINRPGTSYSGGTLPGLVQLSIEGRGWHRKNNENTETITKFFAHEVAHFWNGGMFNNNDSRAAWLHEGGADAFAFKALLDLGLISKLRLKQNFERSYNFCRSDLNSIPLNMSSKLRRYKNYYHCGAFIWLTLDKVLRNQNSDMYAFWEKLLNKAKTQNGKYNSEDFHSILKNEFKQKRLSELIFELEWEERGRSEYWLEQIAKYAGIKPLSDPENLPPEFSSKFYQNLISSMMRKDCQGRVDVYGHGSVFKVRGNETCSILKKEEYVFVGAQGKSFGKGGGQLLREIESICQEKGSLILNYNDGRESVKLACDSDDSESPQWYRLSGM